MADADQSNLTVLTVDLLSAYLANNSVQHGDIPDLVKSTHAALKHIDAPEPPAPVEPEHKPAVGIRKSLGSRTHIISMIDGKSYQTLKRHLSKHGLTPEQYRERYSLPKDYPMVAPAYSESRRAIAERLGLGRKVTGAQNPPAKAPVANEAPAPKAKVAPKVAKAAKAPANKAEAAAPVKSVKTKTAPKVKTPSAKTAPAAPKPAEPAPKPRAPRKAASVTAPVAEAPPSPKPAARKRAAKTPPAGAAR